ncbi:MAG: ATP-binding protein [Gammaproteobacteria bacterium]|nr:ATP-binding protein [Gammaproteobacteria bacterium]MCH9743851.1 ATP-binding protein [Gammaproteobacteria bacterium]
MKAEIEQTLVEQNPHWSAEDYQHDFARLHDKNALEDLSIPEIQIITGIRRSGKSTLMQTLINHLSKNVNPKSILYVNLDDPNYTDACKDAKSFYSIITTCEKLTNQKIEYVFFDEIQNMVAWEKYVKSVYDSKKFKKILISGSNADLLNSEYATLLSGRYLKTHIYPLSFKELLLNKNITTKLTLLKEKPTVLSLLDQLLTMGGFPRIHLLNNDEQRLKLLKNYYETILLKDCIANHNIRDTATLMQLSHYLINNISCLYSYNSLQKSLGSNENTIQNYVHILQDAYFIHQLMQYSYSLKKQSKSKKKAYCIDNGLITAATFKFSNNYGKLLENLVYTELKKQNHEHIFYNNEINECDFIIHTQKDILALQVCYQLDENNMRREISGLTTAMQKYNIPKGVIITYDNEADFENNIKAIPFWQYFSGL